MTIEEVKEELKAVRPYFYRYPNDVQIYLHWTGGHYGKESGDYHFCIDADGTINNTSPLTEIPAATWCRNFGSIAIAMECCYGAKAYRDPFSADLGKEPPTDAQVEAMSQLIAAISDIFDVPIDSYHFMTHAEAADNLDGRDVCPPYGPDNGCERWDLAVLTESDTWMEGGDILRGKAIWYQQQEAV